MRLISLGLGHINSGVQVPNSARAEQPKSGVFCVCVRVAFGWLLGVGGPAPAGIFFCYGPPGTREVPHIQKRAKWVKSAKLASTRATDSALECSR